MGEGGGVCVCVSECVCERERSCGEKVREGVQKGVTATETERDHLQRQRRATKSTPRFYTLVHTLWPEMDMRLMFMSSTSTGIFPTICAQSEWNMVFFALHNAPISFNGCTTPISLLTPITDTSAVSFRIAFSSASRQTRPVWGRGGVLTVGGSGDGW